MSECVEIVIIMKDEERTVTQKYLCYDQLLNMKMVNEYIKDAKLNFIDEPDSVTFKVILSVQ